MVGGQLVVHALEGGRMGIITTTGRLIACSVLFFSGCKGKEQRIKWRRDIAPITKRVPALASCTNMLWHGEIITQNSFLSPPGPSSYRVCCFIPDASKVLPSLPKTNDTSNASSHESITFQPTEKDMLKSEYHVNIHADVGVISEQLNRALLQSPYWGECVYFTTGDVLCIVLFGK